MTRRCPAARQILAELAADIATDAFSRNPSHRNRIQMEDARVKALKVGR